MSALIGMPVGQKERNIETMGILVFEKLVQIEGRQIEFFVHNVLVSMFLFVNGGRTPYQAAKIVKILFYH
ncbi:hypothetical protein GCM10007423_20420 [Dyadobacter endophyticus]|uniref:Uncharacterized protein n=1 Tax=Dyadobacter endophyticus TaxID=1749036 RepID=A0ABQ1YN81_9BACT|nr:hypothetical protein GCM10007423_20420 [Dyadobacter endophyticus]